MIVDGVIIIMRLKQIPKMVLVIHHTLAHILFNCPIQQLAHHKSFFDNLMLDWSHT